MKTTIISHFFNEEYLLPFWLNHHKKYFDFGIMINYASTDKSVEIIKKICPNWKVIDSRNKKFGAKIVNDEVEDVEKTISGFKIALNTTEFILGNFNLLNNIQNKTQLLIPSYIMVDENPDQPFTNLIREKTFGTNDVCGRKNRSLHNFSLKYPVGRHFNGTHTKDFIILWYGFSPFNEEIIQRKLLIQTKIPQEDIENNLGHQHIIVREKLIERYHTLRNQSFDLSRTIKFFLNKSRKLL